jgi:hypothetical protein
MIIWEKYFITLSYHIHEKGLSLEIIAMSMCTVQYMPIVKHTLFVYEAGTKIQL